MPLTWNHWLPPAARIFLALFASALAWDLGGMDMAFAFLAGSSQGFPLRDHWLLSTVMHQGGRRLTWLLAMALCLSVWWPVGPLTRISAARRAQLAASTLLAALVVSVLRAFSHTSCPWDLTQFGGVARYASHWSGAFDGGSGRCFPAGHASSGFSFVGGYFAFRGTDDRLARRWLAAAGGSGLVLGLAQQWRGAHFMSHTLWTAVLCWVVAWSMDAVWPQGRPEPAAEMGSASSKTAAPAALAAAASLWMASLGNAPLWRELQSLGLLHAPGGWLLALALGGMVASLLFALLSVLAWRPLFKPALLLLLLACAGAGHFMWTYHVVIDRGMAASALQTDWHEALELATLPLLVALALGVLVPASLLLRVPIRMRPWPRQGLRNLAGVAAGLLLFAVLLVASFQPLASTMRNHKQLRYLLNPLNTFYAVGTVVFGRQQAQGPPTPVGQHARLAASDAKPPLLVLMVGETGRSGNFAVNGYGRPTTPELTQAGVASFRDAWSCGTHTAESVPCMFSPLGREGFLAREHETENLLDVLQHAGLAVLWIDNQPGGCKGVCDRVPHVSTSALQDPALCSGGECHDEILLAGLDRRIAALPPERRARGVVLVLHPMGSHGPDYAKRSPASLKRFLPECSSAHLPDCSAEQLRNAYDNTIVYTDHVLGATIQWLLSHAADYDGALVYVADHGESLGENNLYLHGLPYALAPDVQKHVPWITWLSPGFERRTRVTMSCLQSQTARLTHDHLFHSVLGLLQVDTSEYRRALDAYSGCAVQ